MLIDIEFDQYGGDYGSLIAAVVRRAVPDVRSPDSGSVTQYNDGKPEDAIGFRNCTWSSGKKNALFVEDMQVRCQYDKKGFDSIAAPAYGEQVVFKPFRVERVDARAMEDTFKTLDKGMTKFADDFGHVRTFGELVTRTAKLLGIKRFATYKRGTQNKSLAQELREFDAGSVALYCDELIAKDRTGKS